MLDLSSFRNTRVLITGGSGFIGGRLAEYLSLRAGARVRVLARQFGRAVYAARLPLEFIPGNLLDSQAVERAAAECDYIFHCAYGASGEDGERRRVTVEGTKNLLAAAGRGRVKRFVHVSSIAVHEAAPGSEITEDSPLEYLGEVYTDSKIDAEKAVLAQSKLTGLPVTILRPTVVYGPRSMAWTITPVTQLMAGEFLLIEQGKGWANPVYIDDVVQALLQAATAPQAVGEAFIVSQGEPVTWRDFYGCYARMLGQSEIPVFDPQWAEAELRRKNSLRNPARMMLSFLGSDHARTVLRQFPGLGIGYRAASGLTPPALKRRLLSSAKALREVKLAAEPRVPPRNKIDFFSQRRLCRIDKARRLLGFEPTVSLDRGMELTEAWLRCTRLIPDHKPLS